MVRLISVDFPEPTGDHRPFPLPNDQITTSMPAAVAASASGLPFFHDQDHQDLGWRALTAILSRVHHVGR